MPVFIRVCLVLCLLPAVARGDQSADQQVGLRQHRQQVFALTHATVVVDANQQLDDATLVIRDGRIESVRQGGSVPADAEVLDFSGKTIYPGFIDAYSETELSTEALKDSPKHWNSSVVPQLSVAQQIQASRSENGALRKQGIVARLLAPAEGVVRGRSAVVSTGTSEPGQALLASNVAQHLELTVRRRSRSEYPGSPMGAVALARQTFYDAEWYRDAWQAANADSTLPRPEHNDALAALQPVINGSQPVMIETSNELFFLRAHRFAAEFGLKLIVRGSGHEYRRIDDLAATQRPVILPLNFPQPPNVATPETAANVSLESLLHWDLAAENPARVHAAGIRFAFTFSRLTSAEDVLKALRKAVKRGLSRQAAVTALTETPAEMFQLQQHLGSIAAGKLASFVVCDGDLFEDKTRITETWVDGEREQHDPEPVYDAAADYKLTVQQPGKYPGQLFVRISSDEEKLSGRISTEPIPAEKTSASSPKADKESDADADDADGDADSEQNTEGDSEESATPDGSVKLKQLKQQDYAVTGQFSASDWDLEGIVRLSLMLPFQKDTGDDPAPGFGRIAWPDGSTSSVSITRQSPPAEPSSDVDDPADSATADSVAATPPDNNGSSETEDEDGKTAADTAADEELAAASFAVNYPLGAYGVQQLPDAAGLTAFQHATIWTSGPAGIIEDGTLLIDDGRIVAVGKDLEIPADAKTVDMSGMHITAGIIDCHSHMATDGGVNEPTQAITCEVRIGDFIDCDDITIYRQLAGGVTVANVLHGSANPIGGQNQVIKLRWGMNDEQLKFTEAPPGVKFALGENVKQSNWGDEHTTRYPQTRMGVEQIFRDSFLAAQDYARRRDAWQQNRSGLPPRRDLELDALREIVEQRRWIHCHSYRQDEILALIRLLDEFQITIGTFQHILEGYKVADALAEHGAMASAFADWWAYKFEVFDAIPYAGALMHEAGVVVSFNSDDSELARHLNQEAAKAVKYGGVAPAEALKFVTLNPARQLRIDQYVGSLEAGKHADFVVWNGSPLSNFSSCQQTWIDGRRYFDRQQDSAAQQSVAQMRNTLIQKILKSEEKMREAGDEDDDPSAMWPRHDEFCHHGHDHEHHHAHE